MGFLKSLPQKTGALAGVSGDGVKGVRSVFEKVKELQAKKAAEAAAAAEQAQIKANEGSIQHGKLMGSLAEKSAAEGAARDLGSTPEASADVAIGGGEDNSAIDTAAGRSKRKRQVFGNAAQSGVNI